MTDTEHLKTTTTPGEGAYASMLQEFTEHVHALYENRQPAAMVMALLPHDGRFVDSELAIARDYLMQGISIVLKNTGDHFVPSLHAEVLHHTVIEKIISDEALARMMRSDPSAIYIGFKAVYVMRGDCVELDFSIGLCDDGIIDLAEITVVSGCFNFRLGEYKTPIDVAKLKIE